MEAPLMDYVNMSLNELDAVIEEMESEFNHDDLPSIYDEVVALRNERIDPFGTKKVSHCIPESAITVRMELPKPAITHTGKHGAFKAAALALEGKL
jgi:hypothetical protein